MESQDLNHIDHSTVFIPETLVGGLGVKHLLRKASKLKVFIILRPSRLSQLDGVRFSSNFAWLSHTLSASGVVCQIKPYFHDF